MIRFLLLALTIASCTTNPPKTKLEKKASLGEKSTINEVDLFSKDVLLVNKSSQKFDGHFKAHRGEGHTSVYKITECLFQYEKGHEIRTGDPIKFESIEVSYTGVNQDGDEFFERLNYGHATFEKVFSPWNFTQSFGPVELDNSLRYGPYSLKGNLKFERNALAAKIHLSHEMDFNTDKSFYLRPGESKSYEIDLHFKEFSKERILLDKIEVHILASENETSTREIGSFSCHDFIDS